MNNEAIGSRIRSLRDYHGFKQQELADMVGVSRQVLSNWERGYTPVSTDGLISLSKILDTSTEYIVNGRYTKKTKTPIETISDALADDRDLLEFFNELSKREDLKLLFKQVKPLKKETIKRIIRYIKIVEDEEANE